MSGLESAASVITLVDIIVKLVNIVRHVKAAPKELSNYINELKLLHDISGTIQQVTTGTEDLNNFHIAQGAKKQGLLEYCNEHLAKLIEETNKILLKKYGQEGVSRVAKWFRRGRFSLGQDLIQGLMQSVEHAKSLLQTVLSVALLCRDKFILQKLQNGIQEMSHKSLKGQRDFRSDVRESLHRNNQHLDDYFILQRKELQESLQQYRSDLRDHSKNLQESFITNHAKSLRLESEGSNVRKWPLANLIQSDSASNSPESSGKHHQKTISLQSGSVNDAPSAIHEPLLFQSISTDDLTDENYVPVLGDISTWQNTSEAVCRRWMANLEIGKPEHISDTIEDSFNEAFANLISESYFTPLNTTNSSAFKSDAESESDSILYIPERPILGTSVLISIDKKVRKHAYRTGPTQRGLFCVKAIDKNMDDGAWYPSDEFVFLLQDPCNSHVSCQHITVELSMEDLRRHKSCLLRAKIYCREGTEGFIFEETTKECCNHTAYTANADGAIKDECILLNRRLAGHIVPDTPSSVSNMTEP